jgi:hypothetical protein
MKINCNYLKNNKPDDIYNDINTLSNGIFSEFYNFMSYNNYNLETRISFYCLDTKETSLEYNGFINFIPILEVRFLKKEIDLDKNFKNWDGSVYFTDKVDILDNIKKLVINLNDFFKRKTPFQGSDILFSMRSLSDIMFRISLPSVYNKRDININDVYDIREYVLDKFNLIKEESDTSLGIGSEKYYQIEKFCSGIMGNKNFLIKHKRLFMSHDYNRDNPLSNDLIENDLNDNIIHIDKIYNLIIESMYNRLKCSVPDLVMEKNEKEACYVDLSLPTFYEYKIYNKKTGNILLTAKYLPELEGENVSIFKKTRRRFRSKKIVKKVDFYSAEVYLEIY